MRLRLAVFGALACSLIAVPAAAAAPRIVAAGPVTAPTDRGTGPIPAVTFSPGGRMWVAADVAPGASARLRLVPVGAGRATVVTPPVVARTARVRLAWRAGPTVDGPYRAYVCAGGSCSATFVAVQARRLEIDTDPFRSVAPGERVPVRVSTDGPAPRLDLVPMNALGATGVPLVGDALPADVGPGVWMLRARQGDVTAYAPVVVRGGDLATPEPGTALVVVPALTWRAYGAGDCDRDGRGDSWYGHPLDPVVPLRCAYRTPGQQLGLPPAFPRFAPFQSWLDDHPHPVRYVTDVELADLPAAVLRRYPLIVFPGHTEYYEQRLYDALVRYRDGGGRLLFLSANSFYSTVAVRRDEVVRLMHRLRTPRQSDFALSVNGFVVCCWPREWRIRYRVTATAIERLPWLFEGTDFRAGSPFGFAEQEVDHIDPALSPASAIRVATGVVPASADVLPVEPTDAQAWVGTRPVPYPPARLKDQRVDVAYARVGAGEVFSWGNVGFLASLRDPSLPAAERAGLARALDNVWTRFAR